jgi:hypothetical protein
MTDNGYVLRLAFFEDEVTKIAIQDAPSGLSIEVAADKTIHFGLK